MNPYRSALAVLLASCAVAAAPSARAGESYDNCTGTIASLPAVITTQGTWCMKGDLSTSANTGSAIEVAANNVIIECNGFKLGGLAGGLATTAIGIRAYGRANTTVRGCSLRGFHTGVWLESETGGYVVEDSRFDANTHTAVYVTGDGSRIQRNQILHTGGSTLPDQTLAHGIFGVGTMDIVDNQVHDVALTTPEVTGTAIGIRLEFARGGRVGDNVISGVRRDGAGQMFGIYAYESPGTVLRDNDIGGTYQSFSLGIYCTSAATSARGNTASRHETNLSLCAQTGDNYSHDPI